VVRAVVNADSWWSDCASRALAWCAEAGFTFEAYTLTELGVPDPDHPARWGALFRAAYHRGLIVPVGFEPSRRPSRAGGACRVWIGAAFVPGVLDELDAGGAR